ncbi:CatB-related O-acetyltransferase [Dyadobacter sp. CY323]|uniref:CatB-related O-acetyltransferase n=1 Tax=Dyadobacter sp. CY323 TaxID=2907302 RepID=UPI001F1665A7|nr:CatB-related O-acetyltransferase [Dyadobacter sp. CY323]MCE6991385.1 hypothetical protein [Dyadobacter sp. CY323]
MKLANLLTRTFGLPFGLIRGIWKIACDGSRDISNKRKYPQSLIDNGCCFTEDTIIGKNAQVLRGSFINHSQIGAYSYVGFNAMIQNAIIGNYCSISTDVRIGLGSHPLHLFSTSPIFYRKNNTLKIQLIEEDLLFEEYKPIIIGSDVWVGANVIVMDGVEVGHGSVIAAGAVVTRDVPPYAVVAGIPAKIIKYRFSPEKVQMLLEKAWWRKNPEEIHAMQTELNSICGTEIS